mgnify:CR=1 FL=1
MVAGAKLILFGGAIVLIVSLIVSGIVGDLKGQPVVASPIYKQHFRLEDGQCLEDESVRLRTWKVSFKGDEVWIEA